MPIGIETAHGFGDICFNIPLIKAIYDKHQDEIYVAARTHCKDALYNINYITKVVDIAQMHEGETKLKTLGCDTIYQITQNIWFFKFREHDNNHSLIDTPMRVAKEFGLELENQRPIFIPSSKEFNKFANYQFPEQPIIAIESHYTSGQSWANNQHIANIINRYNKTHKIIWLSNTEPPNDPAIINLEGWTRRELILTLKYAEIFFSTGSGFFCASLALDEYNQPEKTVCLWIDDLYRYEQRLNELQWDKRITWLHNEQELQKYLS